MTDGQDMESVLLLFGSIGLFALIGQILRKTLKQRSHEFFASQFSKTARKLAYTYKVFSLLTLEVILLYFMVVSFWAVFRLEPLVALN